VAAAIEACARNRYDLVLMDIEMPGMSGFSCESAQPRLHLHPARDHAALRTCNSSADCASGFCATMSAPSSGNSSADCGGFVCDPNHQTPRCSCVTAGQATTVPGLQRERRLCERHLQQRPLQRDQLRDVGLSNGVQCNGQACGC